MSDLYFDSQLIPNDLDDQIKMLHSTQILDCYHQPLARKQAENEGKGRVLVLSGTFYHIKIRHQEKDCTQL